MFDEEDDITQRGKDYYKMSDELYNALMQYLKKYNLSFSRFCKDMNVEEYMLSKIVDRKIKMYSPYSLLYRIAKIIGVRNIPLVESFKKSIQIRMKQLYP